MDKPKIIYVYDALCGWCYGFSPVIKSVYEFYYDKFEFEVISGGMILGNQIGPIGIVAPYIKMAYKTVEEAAGVVFGEAFLKDLEQGETIFSSEMPAVGLSVFKSYLPEKAVLFAHGLQNGIYFDGKAPADESMYRYLAANFGLDTDEFQCKMKLEEFKQAAYYDFALAKQLQVNGFPTVFIQSKDNYFYLITRGFTDYQTLEARIENVLTELATK